MQTEKELRAELVSLLGGRAAEDIVFDTITTGAANDIEKATKIARAMVTRFGMSKRFGMMQIESLDNQYLNQSTTLNCSDETAAAVDEEVMKILKESYKEAKRMLKENRDVLDKIAAYLIEKENITGHEFMEIYCREKGLPMPEKNRGEESLAKMRSEREEQKKREEQLSPATQSTSLRTDIYPPLKEGPLPQMPPVPPAVAPAPPASDKDSSDDEAQNEEKEMSEEESFAAELKKRSYHEKSEDDGNNN